MENKYLHSVFTINTRTLIFDQMKAIKMDRRKKRQIFILNLFNFKNMKRFEENNFISRVLFYFLLALQCFFWHTLRIPQTEWRTMKGLLIFILLFVVIATNKINPIARGGRRRQTYFSKLCYVKTMLIHLPDF